MANKKGRRRRNPNFVVIPFTAALTLGTLVNNVVVQGAVITFTDEIKLISVDGTWSLRDGTAGEGPIAFGLSHGDLTVGEVSEKLNAIPTRRDDIILRERATRPVRRVGAFFGFATEEVFNDGRVKRTKLGGKFRFSEDIALNLWAQNRSGATLAGGASVVFDGQMYGVWL